VSGAARAAKTREIAVGPITLAHGQYRYLATLYTDDRLALARRHLVRRGEIDYGHGTWAGVVIDHDVPGWPRQALDALSGAIRDRLEK